jgi:uncharacterized protein YkwD
VHHRPAGQPLSARRSGTPARHRADTRAHARRRGGRLALGTALSTMVTGLVLAVPVMSGAGGTTPSVVLDSSSSGAFPLAEGGSPVVMGQDGLATVLPSTEVPAPPVDSPAADAAQIPAETEVAAPRPAPGPRPAAAPAAPSAPTTSAGAPALDVEPEAPAPDVEAEAPARDVEAEVPAPDVEAEVLALVNAARAAAGCAPLDADAGLAGVARAHSADMRDRDFFDHVNPDGLDPFDRARAAGQTQARAENIAYGQPTPAAVMETWMNSSGHRANILDCSLRTLGVGVAEGAGGPWWTQLFG